MRAKERVRQYQPSRMYLRRRDHRELIMNEKYHNALWLKTTQNGKSIDNIQWIKYPPKALIGMLRWNNSTYLGNVHIDLCDGHFNYGQGGQRVFSILKLWNCTIAINSYSRSTIWITEDGIVWKKVGYNGGSSTVNDPFPYANNYDVVGKNSIGSIYFNRVDWDGKIYDLNAFTITFIKDEETGEWRTETHSTSTRYSFGQLIGNMYPSEMSLSGKAPTSNIYMSQFTKVGYSDTPDITWVWQMDENANVTQVGSIPLSYAYSTHGSTIDGGYRRYATNPSRTISCYVMRFTNGTYGSWTYHTLVYRTIDGGQNWQGQLIKTEYSTAYGGQSMANFRNEICWRKGKFNLYYADLNNISHHWTSADGLTWTEDSLGDYVDVKLESAFGTMFAHEVSYEYVRILFNNNPDAVSSSYPNVYFYNAIGRTPNSGSERNIFNEGNHNITFMNGQNHETCDEDYLAFTIGDYYFFMADCDLNYNTKSWATKITNYDENNGYESVQDDDYCVVGTIESEV